MRLRAQGLRSEVAAKASALAVLQGQFDKLQIRLQKIERDEKEKAKSLTDTHSEATTLRVSRCGCGVSCGWGIWVGVWGGGEGLLWWRGKHVVPARAATCGAGGARGRSRALAPLWGVPREREHVCLARRGCARGCVGGGVWAKSTGLMYDCVFVGRRAWARGRAGLCTASQIKMAELQASLSSAEAAHAAAQSTIVAVTTDRDDLKEAVTTLRRRIRELETTVARSAAEVGGLRVHLLRVYELFRCFPPPTPACVSAQRGRRVMPGA